ncbi:hypothetical protein IQ06DRAFT_102737 [Phaeosphaeriaceae sp. SRC1lsM3a]|nr:hypothetical protein IQ06DRAFT_102737 [Stagonospora sp. SRC1lsM3a]
MATPQNPSRTSLLGLPREIRDNIIGYCALPGFVYTSSDKPNTANLHRGKVQANTFIDTRICLPCRLSSNVLGVCRQLRAECLQYQTYALASFPSGSKTSEESDTVPLSNILAERLGQEVEEEAERMGDRNQLRITLEAQRQLRGPHGYALPVREELSPRFVALLPLMERSRKLRLVVWAGFDWWNGSRPRQYVKVNGRMRIDETAPAGPDAVSFAVEKILERLPAVEELEIDILAHVGDISRWDLPEPGWANVQYWLDRPVTSASGQALQRVQRRLCGVWNSKLVEASYQQHETRTEGNAWHIKRRGDMYTVSDHFLSMLATFTNDRSLQ